MTESTMLRGICVKDEIELGRDVTAVGLKCRKKGFEWRGYARKD